jgi:DNA-binding response OmpR family regulator/anti-sigma regulatory factor (Ser/Thr protein kinase)
MSQPNSHNNERQRKTILIVEDDGNILHAIAELAERSGYNSILAFNSVEALDLLETNDPDLIIVDVMLRKMDGFQLVARFGKICPLVPIIIQTPRDNLIDRIIGFAIGADAYLTKTPGFVELFQVVEALLNKTHIERKNDRLKVSNHWLRQLETKSKAKGKTANVRTEKDPAVYATIAHDMANEISTIGGALQAIRHLASDSDEIQEECDLMERSLHYSGQLLRRLKNYSEIIKPHLEVVAISELITRAESLIRPRIPSNIVFEVNTNISKLEGKVLVDAEQVIGVLIEITNNAVHALRYSEGIIELSASVQDGMLSIAMSNNGPSIPEDIREQLFMQRVQSSKEKGTGMGLFLAGQVLNTFGGMISSKVSKPNWVTFEIQLHTLKDE